MEFTNEELSQNVEVMSGIKETGKLGYAIARNMRKMRDEAQEYIQLKTELFQKYGEQRGEFAFIKKDCEKEYKEEIGNLPKEKHDIDVYTIPEDVFMSGSLNSTQMATLLWMVKEE